MRISNQRYLAFKALFFDILNVGKCDSSSVLRPTAQSYVATSGRIFGVWWPECRENQGEWYVAPFKASTAFWGHEMRFLNGHETLGSRLFDYRWAILYILMHSKCHSWLLVKTFIAFWRTENAITQVSGTCSQNVEQWLIWRQLLWSGGF
jgi:hypothetical protein